jgi:hypothetical protein
VPRGDTCGERYGSWESIATRFYRSQKADIGQQVFYEVSEFVEVNS